MDTSVYMVFAGVASAGGVFAFGISVGRTRGVRADLEALDRKMHKIANWKDGLPKELTETYVPRRELALELKPIRDSLERIEKALQEPT